MKQHRSIAYQRIFNHFEVIKAPKMIIALIRLSLPAPLRVTEQEMFFMTKTANSSI